MIDHVVTVWPSGSPRAKEDELAWQIAMVAGGDAPVDDDVADMVVNRVIDDAAVAAASLSRAPVCAARDEALAHRVVAGSAIWGLGDDVRVGPEWAAWANGVAVRELDFHDTFLGAEYAHPGDNIPALLAVAQHVGRARAISGRDLVRAIATAYEVQIALARSISLHKHKIDHVAHLGPSIAAGLGALLRLPTAVTYQAVNQALHTSTATRQSRKGQISTWKAYAPAFVAKATVEAVDRAMRGQTSPAPIYEGEDGVIAWMLDGPDARYDVSLPSPGEARRAIMDSFTKEHSAEYQAQAWIDLARRLRTRHPSVADPAKVSEIVIISSHHTHMVIGTGSNDPQKFDPTSTRETLDHSLPYIFAVALQDGEWHHESSYSATRANRPDTVALWRRIRTVEDPGWSRRYLALDPKERAYGGRVEVVMTDGSTVTDEIEVPDAHPRGARPFARDQYVEKFRRLSESVVDREEAERFVESVLRLNALDAAELVDLSFRASPPLATGATQGIF